MLERVERKEIEGATTAHVLAEVAHRLMTIEAFQEYGWPYAGIAARLRRNRSDIKTLNVFRQALTEIARLGLRMITVDALSVQRAADMSQQHGLLTNDALVVAVMLDNGIADLASSDSDFDGIPGITRYGPN